MRSAKAVAKNRERRASTGPIFVVQEHHASHLHYDFRLEVDGVLKSWAVPKGPSLDPAVRRLAVEVEDHPIEYADFEGVIPERRYGAGEVFLWDKGEWQPKGDPARALGTGKLEFTLKGRKLKGKWILVRKAGAAGEKKTNWLLFKRDDAYARRNGVLAKGEPAHAKPARAAAAPKPRTAANALTSPSRIVFPEDGLTKQDVADYYSEVAPRLLVHLADRPLSLLRCPQGTKGACFYQKHLREDLPPSIRRVWIPEKGATREYVTTASAKGVLALVQRGTVELHAWNCRAGNLDYPDQIVMDFDPGLGVGWNKVVGAAIELRDMLSQLGLRSFVKLTGGSGVHVLVPCEPLYGWGQVKAFAQSLAQELVSRRPKLYTAEIARDARKRRIFIDYLRNAASATAIVPYSLRAHARSSVAMPVAWNELASLPGSAAFDVKAALARLRAQKSDPWKDAGGLRQRIPILEREN